MGISLILNMDIHRVQRLFSHPSMYKKITRFKLLSEFQVSWLGNFQPYINNQLAACLTIITLMTLRGFFSLYCFRLHNLHFLLNLCLFPHNFPFKNGGLRICGAFVSLNAERGGGGWKEKAIEAAGL